jgi:serine/threonine-protein kinase RsbW
MPGDYALNAFAIPESLELLHDLFEGVAADHPGVPARELSLIETAVIEIAGNVIEHGRPPGRVEWHLRLQLTEGRLLATLTDTSTRTAPDPADAVAPGPLAESGRGLALARAAVDELTYDRVGECNSWTMIRRYGG